MIVGPLIGSFLYKWFVAHGLDGGWVFVVAGAIGLIGTVAFATVDVERLHEALASGP
jgi:hypothetical protein